MVSERFRWMVVARVCLLAATLALLAWLLVATDYIMTPAVLLLVVAAQTWALIRAVQRSERDLARFLDAIRYEDFFETFGSSRSATAHRLHQSFARIIEDFRRVRGQREEQYHYLQTVVQHISIALIGFDGRGHVELFNTAARKLTRLPRLRQLKQLEHFSSELMHQLETIEPGQQRMQRVLDEGELLMLQLRATEMRSAGRRLKLVTIQNMRSELEEKELEAWQNLIRVLTHEIRNSITPIASLASTTGSLLRELPAEGEQLEDALLAVGTIERRSDGLLRFVEAFRSLYKLPQARPAKVRVGELFDQLRSLLSQQLDAHRILFQCELHPDNLELYADPDLLEQLMINLLTNAMQAVSELGQPRITLRGRMDGRGRVQIAVSDNGIGIPERDREKIFVPFYTTKSDGSGIGLSLSRQIMRLHRGAISVDSSEGSGATFTLTF